MLRDLDGIATKIGTGAAPSRIPPPLVDQDGSTIIGFETDWGKGTLSLARLNYNSPGFADFAGVGKVVEQLRLLVEFIINHFEGKNARQLEEQGMAMDLAQKRLDLIQQMREMNPKFAEYLDDEGQELLASILDRRVIGIEARDDE